MFSLFTREKRDGSYIMIFNLKQLNKHTKYEHFKIKSLQSVLNITRPNCLLYGANPSRPSNFNGNITAVEGRSRTAATSKVKLFVTR